MSDLDEIIFDLISKKVEGPYWDFKQKWYANDDKGKVSLLHDILCMANNLEDRDAYIIIGVENSSCKLLGVQQDQNRRCTANLCCFLRDQDFSGGIRPYVRVETIKIYSVDIDVIVIENSNKTPFFLTNDYPKTSKCTNKNNQNDKEDANIKPMKSFCIKANSIYTRIGDTNTPKNSTADLDKIEYLWKKRFGINKTPLQKLPTLLEEIDQWEKSPISDSEYDVLFHKQYPEYTIKTKKNDRDGHELYMFDFYDSTAYWSNIEVFYHQTLIRADICVGLDGCRNFIVAPKRKVIEISNNDYHEIVHLFYFIKGTIEFLLSQVLCNMYGESDFYRNSRFGIRELSRSVFLFKNSQEMEAFINYVSSKNDLYHEELQKIDEEEQIRFIHETLDNEDINIFKHQKKQIIALKEVYKIFSAEYHPEPQNYHIENWVSDIICYPQ